MSGSFSTPSFTEAGTVPAGRDRAARTRWPRARENDSRSNPSLPLSSSCAVAGHPSRPGKPRTVPSRDPRPHRIGKDPFSRHRAMRGSRNRRVSSCVARSACGTRGTAAGHRSGEGRRRCRVSPGQGAGDHGGPAWDDRRVKATGSREGSHSNQTCCDMVTATNRVDVAAPRRRTAVFHLL